MEVGSSVFISGPNLSIDEDPLASMYVAKPFSSIWGKTKTKHIIFINNSQNCLILYEAIELRSFSFKILDTLALVKHILSKILRNILSKNCVGPIVLLFLGRLLVIYDFLGHTPQ